MRICKVEGCNGKHEAKGFCQMHYIRFLKYGDPLFTKKPRNNSCRIEECNEKHKAKGYCKRHYNNLKIRGNPLLDSKRPQHGFSKMKEYHVWREIRSRCHNKNDKDYKYYGARGIGMCKEWRDSFEVYLNDTGLRPFPKAQIDRIDNEGNYEPNNVRWVNALINNRNKRNVKMCYKYADKIRDLYKTKLFTILDLSIIYKIKYDTIKDITKNKTWVRNNEISLSIRS